jgi:hypothetical protein
MILILSIVLSWAFPFLLSLAFFKPDGSGELVLAFGKSDFKNIMAISSSFVLTPLLISSFKANYSLANVVRTCSLYILGNWALDIFVLLPISKMDVEDWFIEIGSIYLGIMIYGLMGSQIAGRLRIPNIPTPWLGIFVRSPLSSLTTYVIMSNMFLDSKQKVMVSDEIFVSAMLLIGNAVLAFNLIRAFDTVSNLKTWAVPITIFFIMVTWLFDMTLALGVLHWTPREYFNKRGLRLITALPLGFVARDAAISRDLKVE